MAKLGNKGRTIESESDEDDELNDDPMDDTRDASRASSSMSSAPPSPKVSARLPSPPKKARLPSSEGAGGGAFRIKLKVNSSAGEPSSRSSVGESVSRKGKERERPPAVDQDLSQDDEDELDSEEDEEEEEEEEEEDELMSDTQDPTPATPFSEDEFSDDSETGRQANAHPHAAFGAFGGGGHLTARQRAALGDTSLSGPLLELPAEFKGGVLTDAEKEARRAETARRRRNQSEKKLEDDKIETINRLLKAQSSRSRGGRSNNALKNANDANGNPTPLAPKTPSPPPPPTVFRTIQSTKSGRYEVTVSAPDGDARYLDRLGPPPPPPSVEVEARALCKVEGCGQKRKYRVVGGGDQVWAEGWGGCGIEHLRVVQARVSSAP